LYGRLQQHFSSCQAGLRHFLVVKAALYFQMHIICSMSLLLFHFAIYLPVLEKFHNLRQAQAALFILPSRIAYFAAKAALYVQMNFLFSMLLLLSLFW